MAVVYDPSRSDSDQERIKIPSRPNGSLHSRQKRKIADACEWMRLNQTRNKKALIFCLTSPGYTSLANTSNLISKFIENMRKNYGMGEYVWVRETTKAGYPHFHFVAHWHPAKWFFATPDAIEPMMKQINLYWSGLFGSTALNSVRFGSYNPHTKLRTFYLSTPRHAWYLTKYIGKSIGDGSTDYLAEAGFPSVKYKKTVRSFSVSEGVAIMSHPTLYEADYVTTETFETVDALDRKVVVQRKKRVFTGPDLVQLSDEDVNQFSWKWTGHGQTFIGFDNGRTVTDKRRPRKGGNKSDQTTD